MQVALERHGDAFHGLCHLESISAVSQATIGHGWVSFPLLLRKGKRRTVCCHLTSTNYNHRRLLLSVDYSLDAAATGHVSAGLFLPRRGKVCHARAPQTPWTASPISFTYVNDCNLIRNSEFFRAQAGRSHTLADVISHLKTAKMRDHRWISVCVRVQELLCCKQYTKWVVGNECILHRVDETFLRHVRSPLAYVKLLDASSQYVLNLRCI